MNVCTLHDVDVTLVDSMGDDERIVATARQSTDGSFRGWGTPENPGDERLLRFMMQNKHDSVFEFGQLHVHIDAPIFVARQVFRHRVFSYSEMSGRYVEMRDDVYKPPVWKAQAAKNRQASDEALDGVTQRLLDASYHRAISAAYDEYYTMLRLGCSKEQARMVLPLAQMTHWDMSGDLRAWLGFILLRKPSHVQDETRRVSDQVEALVKRIWPRTYEYFTEYRCG